MPQQAPPALELVATAAARAAQPPPYSPSDPYPSPCASPHSSTFNLPFPTARYPVITPGAPPTPPATPRTCALPTNSPSHTRPRHSPPPLDLSLSSGHPELGHPDEYPPAPSYVQDCPARPIQSACLGGWERNIDLDINALPPSPQLSAALRDLRHSHNPAMWGTRKPRRIRLLGDGYEPADYADGVWGWVCGLFEQLAGPVPPASHGQRGGGGAGGRSYAYAGPAGFGAFAPV